MNRLVESRGKLWSPVLIWLIDLKDDPSLRSILSRDGVLYVKLRAGQLPYKDDPQGWKSLLASTVNHRNSGVRAFKVNTWRCHTQYQHYKSI